MCPTTIPRDHSPRPLDRVCRLDTFCLKPRDVVLERTIAPSMLAICSCPVLLERESLPSAIDRWSNLVEVSLCDIRMSLPLVRRIVCLPLLIARL